VAVSKATKRRWFERGAQAFAASFRNVRLPAGMEAQPLYACPLCFDSEGPRLARVFTQEALQDGSLTAEHVPPRRCGPCNHTSGATLDAEAHKRERPFEAMTGRTKDPTKVLLTAGGHDIPAKLVTVGRVHDLKVSKRFKPGADGGFKEAVANDPDGDIHINFYADRHRPTYARICWLRAAYLALFAVMGYRYALLPGLEIVRRQIRDPDNEHIRTFLIEVPGEHPWTDRRIVQVTSPDWLRCWGVQMGRYLALLPQGGDVGLYERISQHRATETESGAMTGTPLGWPRHPTFGIR
jgi:hypothetical protein